MKEEISDRPDFIGTTYPQSARKKVLLFEDRAHQLGGHNPHWFTEIASELTRLDYDVHVLTQVGWALKTELGHSLNATLHRMSRSHRLVISLANAFIAALGNRFLALPFTAIQQLALILGIRHRVKALGRSQVMGVIVLSTTLRTPWVVLLAPIEGKWVVYEYGPPNTRSERSLFIELGKSYMKHKERIRAMAVGLPVVAAAAGGPGEIIEDGVAGLLYPPGSASALAAALQKLAADPDLRRRFGQAAKQKATEFSVDRIAGHVLDFYGRLGVGLSSPANTPTTLKGSPISS